MSGKKHQHKVTINDKRRANKKITDMNSKAVSRKVVKSVFETYYRNQVRDLYRDVFGE
jgi:lysine/ornithine N-monooxygenase